MTTNDRLYWRNERLRLRYEKRAIPVFRAALRKTVAQAVDAQRLGIKQPEDAMTDVYITQAMIDVYTTTGSAFAGSVKLKDAGTQWIAYARAYVKNFVAARITGILETTRKAVRAAIDVGIERGYGIDKIAELIETAGKRTSGYRARLIARTETLSASNAGSLSGAALTAREQGVRIEKVWLSTPDSRTRDTHRAVNGQAREMDAFFNVSGAQLLHPGDPSGGSANTINCRCTTFYRVVGDSDD